jgi:hypothetical protein
MSFFTGKVTGVDFPGKQIWGIRIKPAEHPKMSGNWGRNRNGRPEMCCFTQLKGGNCQIVGEGRIT